MSDEFLWLEDLENGKSLDWVKKHNSVAIDELGSISLYNEFYETNLKNFQSKEKIPYASIRGNYLYNFWKDEKNIRGLIRRTTLKEYKKEKPNWETVLDIDELAKKEDKEWVFKGEYGNPDDPEMWKVIEKYSPYHNIKKDKHNTTRIINGFFNFFINILF